MTYHLTYTSVIVLLMLATVALRRRGMGYDYMLLITAVVSGFFITGLFEIEHWYYHLPVFGITVSVALLFLSLVLILFGVQTRKLK